jgi:uncharacterized protein (TIGR03437 family)
MVAVLLLAPSLEAQAPQTTTLAPSYSTASIANTATGLAAGFAPNSIISIYGSNLAYTTGGVTVQAGQLPITFGGVTVYLGNKQAYLFYVSPQQINALIPYELSAGPTSITVVREGTQGPTVPIVLSATAPGLFQIGPNTVLAMHTNATVITADSPARAGEIIILYALGLGPTTPDQNDGSIPVAAARISSFANLNVLLNGAAVSSGNIQYAGVTPGCAGLYQVNLLLPTPMPVNPEVRLAIGPNVSPPLLILPSQ